MPTQQEVLNAYTSIGRTPSTVSPEEIQWWMNDPNFAANFKAAAADPATQAQAKKVDPGYNFIQNSTTAMPVNPNTVTNTKPTQAQVLDAYQKIGRDPRTVPQTEIDWWMNDPNWAANFQRAAANPAAQTAAKGIDAQYAATTAPGGGGVTTPGGNPNSIQTKPTREQVIAAYTSIGRDPATVPEAEIQWWMNDPNFNTNFRTAAASKTAQTAAAGVDPSYKPPSDFAGKTTDMTISDYVAAAKKMAEDSAKLNRYDQNTPTGSQKWTQNADGTWVLNQTLTPDQQSLLDKNTALNTGLVGGLDSNMGYAVNSLKPIDQTKITASPTNAGMNTQTALMSRLEPQFQRQRNSMDNTLANQGIGIGSEAWNNEQDAFNRGMNDAYTQAGLQGITADQNARSANIQQEISLQNQPLNAFNSLRTGLAAQTPNLNPVSSIAPPDYSGALNQATQANQFNQAQATANNNAQIAANNSFQQGLFSLGGTALSLFGK